MTDVNIAMAENTLSYLIYSSDFKGTVMQIEKALINDHLRVSKVS